MTFGTRPRWKQPPLARRTANPKERRAGIGRQSQTQARMGMDRPGIEPALSHAGCDAATPTTPELRRPRVLTPLLAADFSAEAVTASPFGLSSHSFGWCSLWGANECGLKQRSNTCRAQFSALKLSRGPPVRPFFFLFLLFCALLWLLSFSFCCRRTPFVGARCGQTSAAWKSAGSEAFVAGRSLCTDSFAACWTQMRR